VLDHLERIVKLERISDRSLVSLRVHRRDIERAQSMLALADPLNSTEGRIRSLWVGPNHWMLVSDEETGAAIIRRCADALDEVLHHTVDHSAGLVSLRLQGQAARSILESGTGIDLRPTAFSSGSVRRTKLAQVSAILVALDENAFEIVVDCSLAEWLQQWLTETAETLAADE